MTAQNLTGPVDGPELLAGVTVPIVTTVGDGGVPDAGALRPLLEAIAATGISRIMLAGGNGEGPLIPNDLLGAFAAGVAPLWRGLDARNRLLVNVTAPGTLDVRQRSAAVDAADPDALVVSPPFYFRHRDDEVAAHYAALADLGRPVVVYNNPKYCNPMTVGCLDQVLGLPFVVGIKDSSGDIGLFAEILGLARRHRVGVAQGDETTALDALRAGADGVVPGVANFVPAAAHRLVVAVRAGDAEFASAAQAVLTAAAGIHRIRPGVPSVKAVLAHRGLAGMAVLPPLRACTHDESAALVDYLAPIEQELVSVPAPIRTA